MINFTLSHLLAKVWLVVISLNAVISADFVLDDHETGICQRKYIRNEPIYLEALRGCKVIEGSLQLALMQPPPNSTNGWANYSFPKLREITGYLLIFEVNKLPSLKNLFPNLAVIRGQELVDTHSVVIYQTDLKEIGLKSLTNIERGGVWIVENPMLCYFNSIDWSQITNETVSEGIVGNKQFNQCPKKCHTKCPLRADDVNKDTLCWGRGHRNCQIAYKQICPFCDGNPCMKNRTCCHPQCLGGCSGTTAQDCFVCKRVVHNGTCIEDCPDGFYEYFSRRCVTRKKCLETRAAPDVSKGQGPAPLQGKLYQNKQGKKMCILECPKSTEISENNTTCLPCRRRCRKFCPGIEVDSVEKIREIAGCTRITGFLKISLNTSVATATITKELEENLDAIEEIDDYMMITHSDALESLDFLKNFWVIHGNILKDGKYALVVRSNKNFMELWNRERRQVKIANKNASVLFQMNPKLCSKYILYFVSLSGITLPTNYTTDLDESNGYNVSCYDNIPSVEIVNNASSAVLIRLRYANFKINLTGGNPLLKYDVYFKGALNYPNQTTTRCDEREWTVLEYRRINDTEVYTTILKDPIWESTQLIENLKPDTWYALYVKAIAIPNDIRLNRNSDIIFFQTLQDPTLV